MIRYLRTLGLFWSTALGAEMEYRANFLVTTLTSMMVLAGSIFGLFLFYQHGYKIGGWSWAEALLVLGFYNIIDGFSECVLRPNLSRIVEHVREGTLDFVLLKPIDHQFWLSMRNCSPWGIPTAVFGLILLYYGGNKLDLYATDYLLGVAPMLLGLGVLYSLWFLLATLTIWFVKLYNITEALRSMLEAGKFPIHGYQGVWKGIFTFIIPVAFITTVPAEVMLQNEQWATWLAISAALAIGLFVASRVFWRIAVRSYTSASS